MTKEINPSEKAEPKNDVTSSVSHENWLLKFNKTKEGKMFNLNHEFQSLNSPLSTGSVDYLSYLSNALWISVKGTKMQNDAKEMIQVICPSFFSDVAK
jgi:hypothetical protein